MSWPLDLAQGVRQALGSPDAGAIRNLLAAVVGPGECGAVFSVAEPRLVAAVPAARPFEVPAVRRLVADARRASGPVSEASPCIVTELAPSAEWPAGLALPVAVDGEIRWVM